MEQMNTARMLADMTDEGKFERLATAILRKADYRLRSLTHTGVNADGKTVKSPLDGICMVPEAVPPHMIAVHHTIAAAENVEKKWLHDPATVKARKEGGKPTAPAGDVIKTIEIINAERVRTPDLVATLILTTNQEPGECLVRNVHAVGRKARVAIEIWSCSRLADFLDNDSSGQWLRKQFLGTDQVMLSAELLGELSRKSLELNPPGDDPKYWIRRTLDRAIEETADKKVAFILAESGAGKSVACYKRSVENVSSGGFSFILPHDVILSAYSLEQALEQVVKQLCPSLMAGSGSAALALAGPRRRLVLTVEDISRSGRGAELIEKIVRLKSDKSQSGTEYWQILCPVWPQVVSSLRDETRKVIKDHIAFGSTFSAEEGAIAVTLRFSLGGHPITKLQASSISAALGHDPLLIALHEPTKSPDATRTIANFVDASLKRLEVTTGKLLSTEYFRALMELGKSMLLNRNIEPGWLELLGWPTIGHHLDALRDIAKQGELLWRSGPSSAEKLAFRHDRVRDWILARAAFELISTKTLPIEVASEPYFAEIFGYALARYEVSKQDIFMMTSQNPLALFYSVRHFHDPVSRWQACILSEIERISRILVNAREHRYFRWEAMASLAEADGPVVRPLVERLWNDSWHTLRALFRNGDCMAGVELCSDIEPGVSFAGHEALIDHVKSRHGTELITDLKRLLEETRLEHGNRIGALRLAGYIGEPTLADAIRTCWRNHAERLEHLDEYLWACARCVDNDPATLLGPVCDGWADLPSTSEDERIPSRRDRLAANEVRIAFRKLPPTDNAIQYFILRAEDSRLKRPITYMLHEQDHPEAVDFVVREVATINERLEGTDRFSPFAWSMGSDWERMQELTGRPMSDASRKRLLEIWQNQSAGKHLRKQAFRIWASTQATTDIIILRDVPSTDMLADEVLWQRLRLGDQEAIPILIPKLSTDQAGFWWQSCRFIWCHELSRALESALERRVSHLATIGMEDKKGNADWILSEVIMRLPIDEADALLSKYWDQLDTSSHFVIAALYVATPHLQECVAATIRKAPNPKDLLVSLSLKFGCVTRGHPGVTRIEQIEAVVPYLGFLSEVDISRLWRECNKHGWFDLRRQYLDSMLLPTWREWAYVDEKRAISVLDEFVAQESPWCDIWLDDFIRSGASLDHVMSIIGRWLKGKGEIAALNLASAAVLHMGERRHLNILRSAMIEPVDLATEIIADTEFGVKRRTLRH